MRKHSRSNVVLAWLAIGLLYWIAHAGTKFLEQLEWSRNNKEQASIRSIQYARDGIALNVHVPSGVATVLKECSEWRPWVAKYKPTLFYIGGTVAESVAVLVPYDMQPGHEWLLAIKSNSGHWVTLSPYFPKTPDLSDDQWRSLLASATRGDKPR